MKVNLVIHKSRKNPHSFLLILFICVLFGIFLALSFIPKEKSFFQKADKPPPPPKDEVQEPPPPPPLVERTENVQPGETLTDILGRQDFTPLAIFQLLEDIKPVYDLSKIKAGQEIRIFSTQKGEVIAFEYDLDNEKYLSIQKEKNSYAAEIRDIPYDVQEKMIWGVIEENLALAMALSGEEELLAYRLADLFAWDIDFYTDLRVGDYFKVIFEKKYLRGKYVGYGRILAAEFSNQGKTFQAFRFSYPEEKKWDYFDFGGNSLRKEFLKSPIPFARITSRFSLRRLHPIHKIFQPHYGVDYAAPVGTEVQSTADGTITFTGWNGASGRMIKIRHKNDYETQYLHLRGYARGIRKGAKVSAGQVIGFVGSSGESTGPHLDYRIQYKGRYINPLAWRFKPVNPLEPEHLEAFRNQAQIYKFLFDTPSVLLSIF